MLIVAKFSKTFPKHKGYFLILESFALANANKVLLLPL